MNSSAGSSLLSDVDVTYSSVTSSHDDSLVLRNIRQLPLPSVPAVVPVGNQTGSSTFPSGVPILLPPALLIPATPQPVGPAQTTVSMVGSVIPLPNPSAQAPPNPAMYDPHVARIPCSPSLPLPTFSSSSSSATVPVLSSTTAPVVSTKKSGEENPAVPTSTALAVADAVPVQPSSLTSSSAAKSVLPTADSLSSHPSSPALKVTVSLQQDSAAVSKRAAGASASPTSSPDVVNPQPLLVSMREDHSRSSATATLPNLTSVCSVSPPMLGGSSPVDTAGPTSTSSAAAGAGVSYAVTTLLSPLETHLRTSEKRKVDLPTLSTLLPTRIVSGPARRSDLVSPPQIPTSSVPGPGLEAAKASCNSAPAASAMVTVATPVPAAQQEKKTRHLRRKRDALESADFSIFTSPERNGDFSSDELSSNSSSSISDNGEDYFAYIGRTRRVGNGVSATAAGVAAHNFPQGSSTSKSQSGDQRKKKKNEREKHKKMIIKMRELGGKSDSVTSHGKISQSSQSTNALTPDPVAKTKHHQMSTPLFNLSGTNAEREEVAATTDDEDELGGNAPLTFVSPAAHFADLCAASTKNKGLSRNNARCFARDGLSYRNNDAHVDPITAEKHNADEESEESEHARTGTVRFRFTGAFSDATSDSKVLPATSGDIGKSKQHQQQPKSSRSSSESGGATVLALNIRGMSPLHADVGVVHPFVRVWIVSSVTGQSLVQASAAVPCAVTQPFDIRAHKTRAPWWDAKVALRLSTERLRGAASDAMLLLEVLDFGNETIHGFPLLRAGLYPICWGYMMLRDCTGRSALVVAENVHVQMYRYPQRTPWYLAWLVALLPSWWSAAGAALRAYHVGAVVGHRPRLPDGLDVMTDVPSIYHIFRYHFNRKIPYHGGVIISLRQHGDAGYVPDTTDMLAYEEYLLSVLVSGGGSCAVPRSPHAAAVAADNDDGDADNSSVSRGPFKGHLASSAVAASPWAPMTENYYRMDGERSLLPHDVLQTSAVMGVVTCVSFAHNGTLFALGVYCHLQYVVELRNPLLPDTPVVATLLGHTGHLHRIAFQKEDRYLLSCSSDGTVRVWQPTHPNSPFSADTCVGPTSVQCVCMLPHGFPVYAAIFHEEKIISGGFSDQLFVWSYERPLEGDLPSMATSAGDSTLHLTATFTPQLQLSRNDDNNATGRSAARVLFGELICRVGNAGVVAECGEPTITLSLASNERSNRVWSVHANGTVVCWRAVAELSDRVGRTTGASKTDHFNAGHCWQMSVRHTADCDGATEVQVNGSYAIVVCGHAPLIFVFDATTCEQLRVVSTHLPPATPVTLLPDGEAFVGAVGDPSRLVAWECFDGGLCTAPTGYAQASPLYSVARMSWAESQQLGVLVSRSPCTGEDMVRFTRGPSAPAPGQSAAAYYYAKQEEQYRLQNMPSEITLITIAGTVRTRGTVIQIVDDRASEEFCAMFGGDLKAKRKSEYIARRTQASRRRETERDSRRARLHQETMMADPSSAFVTAVSNTPYDATERGARMNAIINFWRGLVGQHKHGADDLECLDANTADKAQLSKLPHPATHRALQYMDEDGHDEELQQTV